MTADQQKIQAAVNKQAALQDKDGKSGKPIKPIFTEPPRGVIDADFQIGDDDPIDLQDGPRVVEEPVKKVETAAQPPKKEEKKEPVAQTSTNGKATTKVDVKAEGSKRDYTGFQPDEVEHFKQMSRPAFEYFSKQVKEFRALQQQKNNDNYYQHPEAYMLTPEFKKINEDIDFLSKERDHWKQQLLNIRNAKPWYGLQGFDEKTGAPITSGPYKPTDDAELDVTNVFNMAHSKMGEFFNQRQQLQQGWKQRVENDVAAIQKERQARFEWARDAAKLEEKVNIPEIGEVPIKTIRDDFRDMWPAYFRSSPLMDVTCDMFAALQVLSAQVRELQNGVKTEKELKDEVIRAEPTLDGGGQGGEGGKSEKDLVFTDDAP